MIFVSEDKGSVRPVLSRGVTLRDRERARNWSAHTLARNIDDFETARGLVTEQKRCIN